MDKVVTSEVLVGGDFNGHAVSDMDRVFQITVKGRMWGGGGQGGIPPSGGNQKFWGIFLLGGENLRRSDLQ